VLPFSTVMPRFKRGIQ